MGDATDSERDAPPTLTKQGQQGGTAEHGNSRRGAQCQNPQQCTPHTKPIRKESEEHTTHKRQTTGYSQQVQPVSTTTGAPDVGHPCCADQRGNEEGIHGWQAGGFLRLGISIFRRLHLCHCGQGTLHGSGFVLGCLSHSVNALDAVVELTNGG